MQEPKPTITSAVLSHHISRWSAQGPWTVDELQETLREGGVDPDRLVMQVGIHVQALLKENL